MAEKTDSGIKEIIISDATYQNTKIEGLTYINFFFGNNGVGKTTIARAIAELKRPANEVSGGIEPEGVVFEEGKTHRDFNFLVYSQDFIKANFQQPEQLPGVFTIDEENIAQQGDIKSVQEDLQEARKAHGEILKKIESKNAGIVVLDKGIEDDCWDITKELRDRFPDAMTGGKTKKNLYAKIQEVVSAKDCKREELASLYDTAYNGSAKSYTAFSPIADISVMETVQGMELLGKRIVSSSDTDFSKFIKALNATDWVRQGHEKYHGKTGGKCPYCQNELPENFEEDLAGCFDKTYQAEIDSLDDLLQRYKDAGNALWKKLQANLQLETLPTFNPAEYNEKMAVLKGIITANIQLIERKKKEPSVEMTVSDVSATIGELNGIIDDYNKKVAENNEIVKHIRDKKKECAEMLWALLAFVTRDRIKDYKAKIAQRGSEIKQLEEEGKQKQAEITKLDEQLADLGKHIIKTDESIKVMNQILYDSGFQGFSIQKHPTMGNYYQIVRDGGDGEGEKKIAESLSEGEKNFIAFLYFCSLVHGKGTAKDAQYMFGADGETKEITDGRDMRDKIVVIDDPVSSMDSASLFVVSSMVRRMMAICKNNFTLGEKTEKGDYIKQLIILTHNAYFHREVTIGQEKYFDTTSFYLITKNDNRSQVKLCTKKNEEIPTERMNYNPVQNSYAALWAEYKGTLTSLTMKSVIRRILEHYFVQICGYEGYDLQDIILTKNRHRFVKKNEVTGEEDISDWQIVSGLLSYITMPVFGVNDGFHYIDECVPVEVYKELMVKIFDAMGQTPHYDMMMRTVYTGE